MRLSIALFSLSLLLSSVSAQPLQPQSFEADVTIKVGYKYLLSLPDGYAADTAKKWPLIIFLHGAGERGSNLEKLKTHGPPKLIAAGKKFEAIVASPQVPAGDVWNPYGVKALVDELIKNQRVDLSRIYITGISMGGFGTWDTVLLFPDTFAAAIPICGGAGVKFVQAERIKTLPMWIFHGGSDPVVEPAWSQKMYNVLHKMGSLAKLTIYPGVQHDSWTQTYDDPAVWEWLFQQARPAAG